jgi:hypothetical protein
VEERYTMQNPDFDMTQPIPMEDVDKVMKRHLERNKFAKNLDESSDESGYDTESDSDLDSSDDSDDSDDENKRKRKKHKPRKKNDKSNKGKSKKDNRELTSDDVDEILKQRINDSHNNTIGSGRTKGKPDEEITKLIDRLNRMSLQDPEYGSLYYRLMIWMQQLLNVLENQNPLKEQMC